VFAIGNKVKEPCISVSFQEGDFMNDH
jgi:hypothetical protein